MTLPSWLHDLSGSAEMPPLPKFVLFGLPSGLPIQKQFSTQCESNLYVVYKRTRPIGIGAEKTLHQKEDLARSFPLNGLGLLEDNKYVT